MRVETGLFQKIVKGRLGGGAKLIRRPYGEENRLLESVSWNHPRSRIGLAARDVDGEFSVETSQREEPHYSAVGCSQNP